MRIAKTVGGVYGMFVTSNAYSIYQVENGKVKNIQSGGRLAAFKATGNGDPNTWKRPVHADIGCIYLLMGEKGSEKIGEVFESSSMQKELNQNTSAYSAAADLEYNYWSKVLAEDPKSLGGFLGTRFDPATRNCIQSTTAQMMSYLGKN
jgi:hypothetical protein